MVDELEIKKFCKEYSKIYIYGAGAYGKQLEKYIKDMGIEITGFLLTERNDTSSINHLIPRDLYEEKDIGIIGGFKNCNIDFLQEQIAWLDKSQFLCFENFDFLAEYSYKNKIRYIKKIMPLEKSNKSLTQRDLLDSEKILITRVDAIGDLICTTPLIRTIRENYPKARISLLINKDNEDLVLTCPYVDEIVSIEFDESQYCNEPLETYINRILYKAKEICRQKSLENKFDLVISCCEILNGKNSLSEFFISRLCHAKIYIGCVRADGNYKRIIHEEFHEYFYKLSFQEYAEHEIVGQLNMLVDSGFVVTSFREELWISNRDKNNVDKYISQIEDFNKKLIVVVGVTGSTERQNWPKERYKKLFDLYNDDNSVIFIILGAGDAANCYKGLANNKNVIDGINKFSLNSIAIIISMADIYLGANTGLMHMANVYGLKQLVLQPVCKNDRYLSGSGETRWCGLGAESLSIIPPESIKDISVDKVYWQLNVLLNESRLQRQQ